MSGKLLNFVLYFAHMSPYCIIWCKDVIYVVKICLQQVYFGASVTKFYLAFDMLGISCFTGMSYLLRKTHLDDMKGLSYFGRFLAEDFFLAKYLHERQAYLLYMYVTSSTWVSNTFFIHIITRESGNYSDVLPLKATRHDSISNLRSCGASNMSCRQIQWRFI